MCSMIFNMDHSYRYFTSTAQWSHLPLGSNLKSNVYFIEALARASLNTYVYTYYLRGSPDSKTKRLGQHPAVYGTGAPIIPPIREGGECYKELPWAG